MNPISFGSSTLRSLLFYDVRNDADALYNLYQISLANICDLQLLEVAVRRSANLKVRLVSGLAKTIETYISTQAQWQRIKEEGVALFRPEKGGSYEVFERRPLDPRIIAYSAQDVALLFRLEMVLISRMGTFGKDWKRRVMQASASRVGEAHSLSYPGNGKHRAIAPSF
ncbi:unnamed protein product [Cyclocybe aegerita]|uniref:Uncharacterized protein n=1 Tax=Cyclocybe aegerita TaxID=1973307 RepID=A0A8S0XNI8_CYCAE|nr:unnamed protein product [Cyclocybe aegerita]